jgi:ABC-type transport system involved in multi-copper enzyme maturation permease subunit
MSRRSPTAALTAYSLQACLPAKRRIGLLIPCVVAVLFGLLSRGFDEPANEAFGQVATSALFDLVLPITALVVGDAVLGAEIRRGSFTFTWMSPVPVRQIVLARWLGGTLVAGGSIGVAFALAAVVAGSPSSIGPVVLGGVFGAGAYVAVFMAIGAVAQRAAVWSLAFVFLVERLLGAALSGIAQLSPSWEAQSVYGGLADLPDDLRREGIPDGTAAIVRLVIITVVALAIATIRLPRLRMASSTD